MMPKVEAKSNIVVSTSILVALALVLTLVRMLPTYFDINSTSPVMFGAQLAILALMELFLLVLLGSIVEYFRKEPELLVLASGVIITILIAKYLGLFTDNVRTATTLGTFFGIALYVLVASE